MLNGDREESVVVKRIILNVPAAMTLATADSWLLCRIPRNVRRKLSLIPGAALNISPSSSMRITTG